jgi:hypothetical protein
MQWSESTTTREAGGLSFRPMAEKTKETLSDLIDRRIITGEEDRLKKEDS